MRRTRLSTCTMIVLASIVVIPVATQADPHNDSVKQGVRRKIDALRHSPIVSAQQSTKRADDESYTAERTCLTMISRGDDADSMRYCKIAADLPPRSKRETTSIAPYIYAYLIERNDDATGQYSDTAENHSRKEIAIRYYFKYLNDANSRDLNAYGFTDQPHEDNYIKTVAKVMPYLSDQTSFDNVYKVMRPSSIPFVVYFYFAKRSFLPGYLKTANIISRGKMVFRDGQGQGGTFWSDDDPTECHGRCERIYKGRIKYSIIAVPGSANNPNNVKFGCYVQKYNSHGQLEEFDNRSSASICIYFRGHFDYTHDLDASGREVTTSYVGDQDLDLSGNFSAYDSGLGKYSQDWYQFYQYLEPPIDKQQGPVGNSPMVGANKVRMPAEPAIPINPASWVTIKDYPSRAYREEREGTTAFRVEVGPDGRVTDCTVTGSSGSTELDDTTCELVTQRARFKPAHDGNGEPTSGSYSNRVRWFTPSG